MKRPAPEATRRTRPLLLALAALCAAGCEEQEQVSSIFDDIGKLPTREEYVEVELGAFRVPVPIVLESASDRFEPENLMEIELELIAVVVPEEEDHVERLKKRNAGRIRDQVIRVCRTTTRDDLMEPQKVTLKAHLLDAVHPLIGGEAIHRLVVKRVNIDEL